MLCLAALVSWSLSLALARPGTHELLEYDVHLERPAELRYSEVLEDFLRRRGRRPFDETYAAWRFGLTMLPEFNRSFEQSAERWWQALSSHPSAAAELRGLARRLGADVLTVAAAVSIYPLLNIAPRTSDAGPSPPSACTSSLLLSGGVLHGRSLDYEPRDPMAEATVLVRHKRNGALQYTCLQPLVYPTALQWFTCVRAGAFSLSVNARSRGIFLESNTSFHELLRRVSSGSHLLGEIAEKAMAATSYDEALSILASLPVVSSNYFILAGAQGQGAVVTRFGNASSSADVWSLGTEAGQPDGQPPWLRVQTNVDHWVPFGETYATHRREHFLEMMSTPSREQFMKAYFVSNAMAGSEHRLKPEDTGAILRPTTIATVFLDPKEEPKTSSWFVWNATPQILPPLPPSLLV